MPTKGLLADYYVLNTLDIEPAHLAIIGRSPFIKQLTFQYLSFPVAELHDNLGELFQQTIINSDIFIVVCRPC